MPFCVSLPEFLRLMKTKRNNSNKNFPFSRVFELDMTEDKSGHTKNVRLLLSDVIDWHPTGWSFWKAL